MLARRAARASQLSRVSLASIGPAINSISVCQFNTRGIFRFPSDFSDTLELSHDSFWIMSNATNDNDTWSTLGLAALRVLETCKQHQEEAQRQTERDHTEEEKNNDRREYVENRLRELAEFERRYSAGRKGRR